MADPGLRKQETKWRGVNWGRVLGHGLLGPIIIILALALLATVGGFLGLYVGGR